MTIGFAYDTPPIGPDDPRLLDSVAAEYEDAATLDWIRCELSRFGAVEDLPWGPDSAVRVLSGRFDLVFNITEGTYGRNRESLLPGVCELAGTPYTGSDSLALGLSLDKEYTKILASSAGVPTPNWARVRQMNEVSAGLPGGLDYPVIVKPITGGSSIGVHQFSRATDAAELQRAVEWVITECRDEALIEEFIPGREFVAGILNSRIHLDLPVAELMFPDGGPDTFYSVEWKSRHEKRIECPADVSSQAAAAMQESTVRVFDLIDACDLCRADFRLAADGTPYFIEINPLPGLSPFYSVFPVQVQAAGEEPSFIIETLVANACRRGECPSPNTTAKGRIRA